VKSIKGEIMKKVLIGLFVIIGIAVVAGTIFVGKLDGLIADAIRTEGSETLGSKVDVKNVVTDLKQGSATITGLTVANPSNYKSAHALVINDFTAQVDYQTQTAKQIVIEKPIINAEIISVDKNNFQDLLDGMPADTDELEDADEEELILTIEELQLNNAQVNVTNEKLGQQTFVMDNFVVRNLTGKVDQISDTLVTKLTNHISSQVTSYAKQQLTEMVKEKAKEKVKEVLSEKINEKIGDKLKGSALKNLKLKLR